MKATKSGQRVVLVYLLGLTGWASLACSGPSEVTDDVAANGSQGGATDGSDAAAGASDGQLGDYQLGGEPQGDGGANGSTASNTSDCDPNAITLKAIVRDFNAGIDGEGHPDFETFGGMTPTQGLVELELGDDGKPVYTGLCSKPGMSDSCPNDQQMTSREAFDQWYRSEANPSFEVFLSLEQNAQTIRFESGEFFPLDGVGLGNQDREHNYHFTTEVHTEFEYLGGEIFRFVGDDDVWIFVNGRLAVDLGGLHGEATGVVDLDAMAKKLGLSVGSTYTFDLFHAERHTEKSRFLIDTNLHFLKCGQLVAAGG